MGNKPLVCFQKKEVFTEDTEVSLSEKHNFWRIPRNPWSIFALSDFVMQTLLTEFCVLCFFTITPSRFKAFPSGVPRYLFIAPGFITCVSASQVLRFSWHPPLPIGGRRLCSRVSDSAWMRVPHADVFLVQFVFLQPPQAKWIARNTQVLLQGARLVDEGTLFLPPSWVPGWSEAFGWLATISSNPPVPLKVEVGITPVWVHTRLQKVT